MTACAKCGHDPDAPIARSWAFVIDRDPPSLNERIYNGARGWRYRKERDAWCWEIRAVVLLRHLPKATGKRRVTLTRHYYGRQQERDTDNLAGGGKIVVDALALEGLLKSDAPTDSEIHWMQERGTPTGLRVLIEELV